MSSTVSEEIYREFLKTFQSFRDPVELTVSNLMSSPLVRMQMQPPHSHLPHQALQASFRAVLTMVAAQNREYADLLHGRFWEGKQIEEMLTAERPLPMSKRTFSNYQRNAIQTFAFLFLQAENNLQSQLPTIVTPSPPEASTTATLAATEASSPPADPMPLSVSLPVSDGDGVEHQLLVSPAPLGGDSQVAYVDAGSLPLSLAPKRRRFWLIGGLLLLFTLVLVGVLMGDRIVDLGAMIGGSTAELLFADDFEQGAVKWNPDSVDWAIRVDEQGNHFYCVNTSGPSYTYAIAGNTTWQDYTLQLDLKLISTAAGGSGNILWRVADGFYPLYLMDFFAEADGNGFALERDDGRALTTLDQSLNRLPTGVWLPLRIEVAGNQMQLFVGTETLPTLQATDPQPVGQGGIGLGAGFSQRIDDGRWEICFDNIEVTKK